MQVQKKTIRIFISSPGDVAHERDSARKIIEGLQKLYAEHYNLIPVFWEDLPLAADASFQQGIDMILNDPEYHIDLAIFILWSRLGSPIGPSIRREDNTEFRSGTEREFHLMLQARTQSGGKYPHILAYVRNDQDGFNSLLEKATSTQDLKELVNQKNALETFIEENFLDAKKKINIRAYHSYNEPVTFSARLRTHLKNFLDTQSLEHGLSCKSWDGPPYRGLETFQLEHARIFFGRDEEIFAISHRLREREKEGCASVVIIGGSGSGKSSLARAGILPTVISGQLDSEGTQWRFAVMTPGEIADDPFKGFVRKLTSPSAIPEMAGLNWDFEQLAKDLRCHPDLTVRHAIRHALADLSSQQKVKIRLFLLVDQLEELFTNSFRSSQEVEDFLMMLLAMASQGIWVLFTLRNDFYHECQRSPSLLKLKNGLGLFDLLPPDASDIHRIITGPATMSGLIFESNSIGETLDQRILNEVVGHPEALPLLEFVLRELYEFRNDFGKLTWKTYENLGGVEGALGSRAERVYQSLPEPSRDSLPMVLQNLVTLSGKDLSPIRCFASQQLWASNRAASQLIEVFIQERLIVSASGEIAVTHEAILRHWERAAQWIRDNSEILRQRAWLRDAAKRWLEEGQDKAFLLKTPKLLDRAEILWIYAGEELDGDEKIFIIKSFSTLRSKGLLSWFGVFFLHCIFSGYLCLYVSSIIPGDFFKKLELGLMNGGFLSFADNMRDPLSLSAFLSLFPGILFTGWATWIKVFPTPTHTRLLRNAIICMLGAMLSAFAILEDESLLCLYALFWLPPIINLYFSSKSIRRWKNKQKPIRSLNFFRAHSTGINTSIIICYFILMFWAIFVLNP